MANPGERSPVLLPGRAAQRLAAIYRQHRPGEPAPALGHHASASAGGQALQPFLYVAVLDVPFNLVADQFASLTHSHDVHWQQARDTHTEVWLTCTTLRKLHMLNGSLAQARHNGRNDAVYQLR